MGEGPAVQGSRRGGIHGHLSLFRALSPALALSQVLSFAAQGGHLDLIASLSPQRDKSGPGATLSGSSISGSSLYPAP